MGSTKHRPRTPAPVQTAPDIDGMRQIFLTRLQSELIHFKTLSSALSRAVENPAWIFDDLVFRAHRLQGGASIVEVAEVAAAASALELAAVTAAMSHAQNTDPPVWDALSALLNLMGSLEGGNSDNRIGT